MLIKKIKSQILFKKCIKHLTDAMVPTIFFCNYVSVSISIGASAVRYDQLAIVVEIFNVREIIVEHPYYGMKLGQVKSSSFNFWASAIAASERSTPVTFAPLRAQSRLSIPK
jgi:hypothetical protein